MQKPVLNECRPCQFSFSVEGALFITSIATALPTLMAIYNMGGLSFPLPSIFTWLLLFSLFSVPSSSTAASPFSAMYTGYFSKIYAFGDSYTDTGNTDSSSGPQSYVHVSNFPYGITYFHHPTNRYSDGRLVVDFLADALSLPFIPPYRNRSDDPSHGVNFAVAGATAVDHAFYVNNSILLDLTPNSLLSELHWFNEFLGTRGCRGGRSPACREAVKDALFWVGEIGANDYAYITGSTVPYQTVQNLAIKNTVTFLQALLSKGAKHIVVQGLPMIGCLPLALNLAPPDDRDPAGCVASANGQARMHNARLQSELVKLRQQNPDAFISYADYWSAHYSVMRDPAKFRLREPFKTCCGTGGGAYNFDVFSTCGSQGVTEACPDPAMYVNWDGVHFTEAMYKVTADMFLREGFMKPSFRELLMNKRRGG